MGINSLVHLVNPTLAEQFFTMLGVIDDTFHFSKACLSFGRGKSSSDEEGRP